MWQAYILPLAKILYPKQGQAFHAHHSFMVFFLFFFFLA
jgi:hypothetical protein